MSVEIPNDFCPDLNELENKIGRKTPESLLVWIKDAADWEDRLASDALHREEESSSDGLSDKINSLRQEMKCLRCADVKILRQLVAVHEGIEAMRWLMEERGISTSHCSSLSGSMSSLVTIEDHVPPMSPSREEPSSAFPQDMRLTAIEETSPEPESASSSRSIEVESYSLAPLTAASSLVGTDVPKSQVLESGLTRLHIRTGAETIRRVLLRSCKRRQLKPDSGGVAGSQDVGERHSTLLPQETLTFQSHEVKKDEFSAGDESDLLGYDAQWSWVDSKDDVTFL
ncbi:leucine rich adaptor protein 1-like [Cyprinodon tularosa]|uniref:leucine rich adaptor protein 1-like n=1 Tax=Cyprinodon tularosa TaxID=77115 RepID=UPI0018E247D7|nr:leucine rich adaptor protein 1-like [Cyprinodon tularosa]